MCLSCGRRTEFVIDSSQGHSFCRECGGYKAKSARTGIGKMIKKNRLKRQLRKKRCPDFSVHNWMESGKEYKYKGLVYVCVRCGLVVSAQRLRRLERTYIKQKENKNE
jgi:hypothetical protein